MQWLIIPLCFWTGAALAQDAPVIVSPARKLARTEAPWLERDAVLARLAVDLAGFRAMSCGWTQGSCRMTRIYGH
jgi:hypothetical protein